MNAQQKFDMSVLDKLVEYAIKHGTKIIDENSLNKYIYDNKEPGSDRLIRGRTGEAYKVTLDGIEVRAGSWKTTLDAGNYGRTYSDEYWRNVMILKNGKSVLEALRKTGGEKGFIGMFRREKEEINPIPWDLEKFDMPEELVEHLYKISKNLPS